MTDLSCKAMSWNITNVLGAPGYSPTGGCQFSYSGPAGQPYRIWTSTDVATRPIVDTWTLLTNASFTGGTETFTDSNATNFPSRFYIMTTPQPPLPLATGAAFAPRAAKLRRWGAGDRKRLEPRAGRTPGSPHRVLGVRN